MSTIIIDMNTHKPVLAKDIAPSKDARTILDNTIAQAKAARTSQAWAIIPTANGTTQPIAVLIR